MYMKWKILQNHNRSIYRSEQKFIKTYIVQCIGLALTWRRRRRRETLRRHRYCRREQDSLLGLGWPTSLEPGHMRSSIGRTLHPTRNFSRVARQHGGMPKRQRRTGGGSVPKKSTGQSPVQNKKQPKLAHGHNGLKLCNMVTLIEPEWFFFDHAKKSFIWTSWKKGRWLCLSL